MPSKRVLFATIAVLGLMVPGTASADPITAFGLFGGTSVSLGANNNIAGLAGSNGTVTLSNAGSTVMTLEGGGSISTADGVSLIKGSVTSNSSVSIGIGVTVKGSIDSGGNVFLDPSAVVEGSIRAAGFVSLDNGAKVLGNVDSGVNSGNVALYLGNATTSVAGTVTHKTGTTISSGGGTVGVNNVGGSPAAPTPYVATVIPAATVFSSGAADNTIANGATLNLAPGSYDDVFFGSGSIIQLSAGTYYFGMWDADINARVRLPTTGDVRLYFTELVHFKAGVQVQGFGGAALTAADMSRLYTETYSYFQIENGGNAGMSWLGTLFASGSSSDIYLGSSATLCGTAVARDTLNTDNGFRQECFPAAETRGGSEVPEPASLVLLGMGLLGLAGYRRARR